MKLTGLHILLTYQCTFECSHCFAWGSPRQTGELNLDRLEKVLAQAQETGTVESIYFEGGEPFLYYPTLLQGVCLAAEMGFQVGIVSNAYWAISEQDALAALLPFSGLVQDLTISSDLFHYDVKMSRQAQCAQRAAQHLGIPTGVISIERPEVPDAASTTGQLPEGNSGVMFRGRAWEKLAPQAALHPWEVFDCCPHEDLHEPGRVHLDPLGYLHLCQGIVIGNLFEKALTKICTDYRPEGHPVVGPLLTGGPVELVKCYDIPHPVRVPDACYLCYSARLHLRSRFPAALGPDQMYGIF